MRKLSGVAQVKWRNKVAQVKWRKVATFFLNLFTIFILCYLLYSNLFIKINLFTYLLYSNLFMNLK